LFGFVREHLPAVVIPTAVYNELIFQGARKKGVSEIEDLISRQVIVVKEVTDESLVKALNKDLDLGESEAIVLALSINADLIIIDEADARRLAEIYKLKKTGFSGHCSPKDNEEVTKKRTFSPLTFSCSTGNITVTKFKTRTVHDIQDFLKTKHQFLRIQHSLLKPAIFFHQRMTYGDRVQSIKPPSGK